LITSIIPFGFADVPVIDTIPSETSPLVSSTPKESRNISVSLQESVGIATNSPQKKAPTFTPTIISTSDSLGKMVYLSESLHITSSIFEQTVALNSHIIQPQATLDRVAQIDKIKDRKKNSKVDSFLADEFVDNSKSDTDLLLPDHLSASTVPILISDNIAQQSYVDFSTISENLLINYNFENILQSLDISTELSLDTIFNFNILNFDSTFDLDVDFVVVIFAPLVFFLFIYSEDVKFKFEKVRPILSFVFVVILLSTVVITPYSISQSYWPEAYADSLPLDTNSTASADNTSSSSTPAEDTTEATTSDNTDTSVDSASSTS
jgi:hypothetical protein